jgi:hypothetical protein
MNTPNTPPEASPQSEAEKAWLEDFAGTARASSQQIAIVVRELEQAVGAEHMAVVAPLVLRNLIDSSSEMANLMAADRQRQRAMAPRPADPAWHVHPAPVSEFGSLAAYLNQAPGQPWND